MKQRTVVTFQSSSFNTTEPQKYFINECFGDDLARFLAAKLRTAGIETDNEPRQEDFGWYFRFRVAEGEHCAVLVYRPGENSQEGDWICVLERERGFFGSILGQRQRGIANSAIQAIQDVLAGALEIQNIRWHGKKDKF